MKLLKIQDNFTTIRPTHNSISFKPIVETLKPEVIFALPGIAPLKMQEMIENLVAERHYIHIDVKEAIDNAIKRGTVTGKAFEKALQTSDTAPIDLILEQLKRILYYNPLNKKFVITNFSESRNDFMLFEKQVCVCQNSNLPALIQVVTFTKEAVPVTNPFIAYLNNKTQFETDLRTFFQNIDKDNSGTIDFNEFITYMMQISQ